MHSRYRIFTCYGILLLVEKYPVERSAPGESLAATARAGRPVLVESAEAPQPVALGAGNGEDYAAQLLWS